MKTVKVYHKTKDSNNCNLPIFVLWHQWHTTCSTDKPQKDSKGKR